uniref:Putative secreted protein n=1 Tax=Ixodes ricinus TaxID=34613 RepID=A0A6B0UTA0_IXORI
MTILLLLSVEELKLGSAWLLNGTGTSPISGSGGMKRGVILRRPSGIRVSICLSVGPLMCCSGRLLLLLFSGRTTEVALAVVADRDCCEGVEMPFTSLHCSATCAAATRVARAASCCCCCSWALSTSGSSTSVEQPAELCS